MVCHQGKVKKSKRSGANALAIVPVVPEAPAPGEELVSLDGAPTVPGIMKGVRDAFLGAALSLSASKLVSPSIARRIL